MKTIKMVIAPELLDDPPALAAFLKKEFAEPGWYWHKPKHRSEQSPEVDWQAVYVNEQNWVLYAGDEWGEALAECEGEFIGPLEPPGSAAKAPIFSVQDGCRAKLAPGQHWSFCGESDMGQSLPVLCTECGGEFRRQDDGN